MTRQLHEEFSRPDGASPLVIEGLALAIVGELNRAPAPRETGRPAWISRARDLLDARICEPVRLTELASELGVNPSYLSRAFRRAYGVSLSAWLRRRRVEVACAALADPAASLAQVAHALGFADQSHLCRSFRRVTGLTPGAWRRRR
jgi:AraC-like DNA-binding protein